MAKPLHSQQIQRDIPADCVWTGQPERLEFGHSFFKGKSFCATASGKTVSQWLSGHKRIAATDNVSDVPRTTFIAWRRKKRGSHSTRPASEKAKEMQTTNLFCVSSQKLRIMDTQGMVANPFCSSYEGKTSGACRCTAVRMSYDQLTVCCWPLGP